MADIAEHAAVIVVFRAAQEQSSGGLGGGGLGGLGGGGGLGGLGGGLSGAPHAVNVMRASW